MYSVCTWYNENRRFQRTLSLLTIVLFGRKDSYLIDLCALEEEFVLRMNSLCSPQAARGTALPDLKPSTTKAVEKNWNGIRCSDWRIQIDHDSFRSNPLLRPPTTVSCVLTHP
jgi:hypothetical protein